jgi:hypothetical protein
MVGKIYGGLVVIGYDDAVKMAKVRCKCGNTEHRRCSVLERGQARICRECQERKRFQETIALDMQGLTTLEPAITARVIKAFAQHLALCKKYKAVPTRLAKFITEALADPSFGEEMDQSFEARLQRSNPQAYHQYQRPKEMI